MPENIYRFVYDQYGNTKKIKVLARGVGVQASNYTNKGTSFTAKERRELMLEGLVPPAIRSLESQIENSSQVVNCKQGMDSLYLQTPIP